MRYDVRMTAIPFPTVGVSIAFARGPEGLTCKADEAFARENGRGPIILDSPVGAGEVQILSAKQTSSLCRVQKAP